MNITDMKVLCNLIDKKLDLLEDYNGLTDRILIDDYDKLDNLLNIRQDALDGYIKNRLEIDSFILNQPTSEQTQLKEMLNFQRLANMTEEYKGLEAKLKRVKTLTESIKEKDVKIGERFEEYRVQMMNEMLQLQKSKTVIDYVNSTSQSELFNGKSFDQKQ